MYHISLSTHLLRATQAVSISLLLWIQHIVSLLENSKDTLYIHPKFYKTFPVATICVVFSVNKLFVSFLLILWNGRFNSEKEAGQNFKGLLTTIK